MKNVKYTLLTLQISGTLCDFVLGTLVIPYIYFPVIGYSPRGLLAVLGVNPGLLAYIFVVCIAEVGASVLAVFKNQYNHLARRDKTGRTDKSHKIFLIIHFTLPVIGLTIPFLDIPDQTNIKTTHVLQLIKCPTQDLLILPVYVVTESPLIVAVVLTFFVTTYTSEAMYLLTCSIYHLQKQMNNTTISQRTRILERRFYYIVYAQSAIPLVIVVFPSAGCICAMYYSYYNQAFNNICFFILSSHGLFGSISTICAYQEYRAFITNMLCLKQNCCKNINKVTHYSNSAVV